jgi:L-iditol 2-dehydrogenase
MPADTGTLAEPLSCVLNGFEVVHLAAGETVLVIGAGPMGALNAQAAKAKGAGRVIVTDPVASRLEMAAALGVDVTIDVSKPDYPKLIMDATGGRGADVVIVTAPVPAVQSESIDYAVEGGRINLFASLPPAEAVVPFNTRTIHYRELIVTGSTDSRREQMEEAIDMLAAGSITADAFITHRLPLEKLLDGFGLMERRESMKVVIHPNGTPSP